MSKKDVIRLSLVNSMNRIYMLNENSFVSEMHLFDVEKLVTDEFLKMFKLIDLNYSLATKALNDFTSWSSSTTSTQKSHLLLPA